MSYDIMEDTTPMHLIGSFLGPQGNWGHLYSTLSKELDFMPMLYLLENSNDHKENSKLTNTI
uniref:Uncharacterized protein n=1 Tax=Arundo donax TaxID=35708 RepID=A0A0A9GZ26_ARUDO